MNVLGIILHNFYGEQTWTILTTNGEPSRYGVEGE